MVAAATDRLGEKPTLGAVMRQDDAAALKVFCRACGADPDQPCENVAKDAVYRTHGKRRRDAGPKPKPAVEALLDGLNALGATSQAASNGHDTSVEDDEPTPSSWTRIDLTDALQGIDVEAPKLWHRSDGVALIYRGRVHWFQGESESCKSWAAQVVAAVELKDGHDVLYIDNEDDERGVVARFRSLGVPVEAIQEHLVYVRPDEALRDRYGRWTDAWVDFADLLDLRPYTLAVIDGVTEAMTIEGLQLLDNSDIAAWMRLLPKRIAAETGAAVICIDHVTKASDTRGRYAIGGQHKLAGVTGATYVFTTVRQLARAVDDETEGLIAVTVTKDRPGYVRARAPEQKVGTFSLRAWPDGHVLTALDPPGHKAEVDMAAAPRILAHLAVYDGATQTAIEKALGGKTTTVRETLRWMAAPTRQWLRIEKVGQAFNHYLTDLGRAEVPEDE